MLLKTEAIAVFYSYQCVYLVALDHALTDRFLQPWISKDAGRSLSWIFKSSSPNRTWH